MRASGVLDTLELSDRQAELTADARVRAGKAGAEHRSPCAECGQRNGAARGQTIHQHAPAMSDLGLAADDVVHRDKHIAALRRAVLEGLFSRKMPPSDLHARRVGGNEGERDADVVLWADQMVGIVEPERESQNRRDRRERDVALVPRDADAKCALALMLAVTDDALVGNGGGVRAGFRCRQGKAGDLDAFGEARQVIIPLLIGAVAHQQLCRAKRIRNHHGDCGCRAAARDLHHDMAVHKRGEA